MIKRGRRARTYLSHSIAAANSSMRVSSWQKKAAACVCRSEDVLYCMTSKIGSSMQCQVKEEFQGQRNTHGTTPSPISPHSAPHQRRPLHPRKRGVCTEARSRPLLRVFKVYARVDDASCTMDPVSPSDAALLDFSVQASYVSCLLDFLLPLSVSVLC
jgi:hypothetical protein